MTALLAWAKRPNATYYWPALIFETWEAAVNCRELIALGKGVPSTGDQVLMGPGQVLVVFLDPPEPPSVAVAAKDTTI